MEVFRLEAVELRITWRKRTANKASRTINAREWKKEAVHADIMAKRAFLKTTRVWPGFGLEANCMINGHVTMQRNDGAPAPPLTSFHREFYRGIKASISDLKSNSPTKRSSPPFRHTDPSRGNSTRRGPCRREPLAFEASLSERRDTETRQLFRRRRRRGKSSRLLVHTSTKAATFCRRSSSPAL